MNACLLFEHCRKKKDEKNTPASEKLKQNRRNKRKNSERLTGRKLSWFLQIEPLLEPFLMMLMLEY